MFKSTRLRLTLSYLAAIMIISIGFSVMLYNSAVHDADMGLRRQTGALRQNLYFTRPGDLEGARSVQLDKFRSSLLWRLVAINAGMLVVGAAFSSWLAKRNLTPLEDAMQAQTRFTSDAAHELRTPLTAMKTEIEVALRSGKLSSADAKELLSSNLEEIGKLETLTSALLRLARANGTNGDAYKAVPLRKAVDVAAERFDAVAKNHSMKIDTSKVGSEVALGDQDQLVELVAILLDNAIKYGKPKMTINLTTSTEPDHVELRVEDHGIGIKASDMPHIFERFYRADLSRTKNQTTGYGLGLSLAEQIVRQHKGSIRVKSELGSGTTFIIALPKA
jgi:two-component system sensor histidine kinase CiaH